MEEKYITGEELLDVLAKVVGASEISRDSVIVLDGFTGFTPITVLMIYARPMTEIRR